MLNVLLQIIKFIKACCMFNKLANVGMLYNFLNQKNTEMIQKQVQMDERA